MKNPVFAQRWETYVQTLSDVSKKRVTRLEKCIEEFESEGYDVSTMGRNEAILLVKKISDNLAYSSSVAYCSVYNAFVTNMENETGNQYERIYANKGLSRSQMYTSEDQFLDDVENRIDEMTLAAQKEKNLSDRFTEEYKAGLNYIAVYLILRFYGFTTQECVDLKMSDIYDDLRTIIITRDGKPAPKQFSERAWKHIYDYEHQTYVTHFWANQVRYNLPNTGYLFRVHRVKKNNADEMTPVTQMQLITAQYRLTKGSNIKKWLPLSGAFINYPKRISKPVDLCDFVHNYIGAEPIADVNINKNWVTFLDLLNQSSNKKEDALCSNKVYC
jgi:hypothetical protein